MSERHQGLKDISKNIGNRKKTNKKALQPKWFGMCDDFNGVEIG